MLPFCDLSLTFFSLLIRVSSSQKDHIGRFKKPRLLKTIFWDLDNSTSLPIVEMSDRRGFQTTEAMKIKL